MSSPEPVDDSEALTDLGFLAGGGDMGARIRVFDWASHPFGSPEHWPIALKLSVDLCLHSTFPTAIYWGPDLRLIYNDAWAPIPAERHPAALGRAGADVWRDIWDVVGPQLDQVVRSGTGFAAFDQLLAMERDGVPTQTWWNYSFSPIRGDGGAVLGVMNQGNEVTARVLSEQALRRARDERDFVLALTERQRSQHDPDNMMQLTAERVGAYLRVDRAGFFQVDRDSVMHFGACWVDGALPALTGSLPSAAFGAQLGEVVRAGGTLTFGTRTDETAPNADALTLTGTDAGVCVPLVRNGVWQAGFYLSNAAPRDWTPGEIALIEEVAEMSWDAVARVSATRQLQAANAGLRDEVAERTAERDQVWHVSRDMLGICDLAGVWIEVNPAWTAILGWDTAELLGRDARWLYHPDDMAATVAEMTHIVGGGAPRLFENRFRARDGEYRVLSWQATMLGDRIYTNARDVTEERRQQAALLAAEERSRLVLEAMDGVGMWTYDLARDRFSSDLGFAALYGFGPDDVARGVGLADVVGRVHPEDLPRMQASIAAIRETGQDGSNEYRLQLPDGTVRWIMARNHVMRDAEGAVEKVVGVGVDVSRQRELEERLRQSQKMEAVGQLTGGLAHDFNNLLTGISGALELMQLRLKQGRIDDLQRYIGAAQGGAGRAAALTHRLLAFSRRQPLDPRPIDVPRLIAGMEDLVRGTLGPAVTLELSVDPSTWPILADANQLENALLNLCINARDAMPAGGAVVIATKNVWLNEAEAHERDLPAAAYLALSVTDGGTGMTAEVIARAFDPFFTTKPMGQGTGLGLSMIYGFVRQSGGHVQIRSGEGMGTTMSLYLPRHYGAAQDPNMADDTAEAVGQVSETVLVVDDEPTVRMLVTEMLGEMGYTAIEAETGAEALDLLRTTGRIDLLVTDVGLPGGMNGRQVADAARVERPDLPILFITGFAENAVVGDGPLEPGMALIAKPFALETLAARIRAMVAGS